MRKERARQLDFRIDLSPNYQTSVRYRGARHRLGTNVYKTSYVGQGIRAITQDTFLGRGAYLPLIDILKHIGLRYDENAPLEVIDEMMRLVGPNSSILRLEEELSNLQTELGENEADYSLRTSPTLSVPYVEDTADMDALFCLDRWEHDISTSEANKLGNSPYLELPDTIASADRPEEHGWDLSAQFASPISYSGEYLEPGSMMSIAEEGFRLWEQPQTSS
ncbi:hypothetical protein P885DRAFT_81974 [Corynascus similis CBS 632.67]